MTMTKKSPHRQIKYVKIDPVDLGGYDPQQDSYYADTAYTPESRAGKVVISTRKLNFPDSPYQTFPDDFGFRGDDIIGKGDQGSILDKGSVIKTMPTKGWNAFFKLTPHDIKRDETQYQTLYFPVGRGKIALLGFFLQLGFYGNKLFTYGVIFSALMLYFVFDTGDTWVEGVQYIGIVVGWWLATFIAWKLSAYLIYKDGNDKWIEFDRRTGMFSAPNKDGTVSHIPYASFEPRLYKGTTGEGLTYHKLTLMHCSGIYRFGVGETTYTDAVLRAAYIEQFMDITQPLPDIPILEQYRHLDPTTAAYDKANGREPRYWRDKTDKDIQDIAKKVRLRVKHRISGAAFCG